MPESRFACEKCASQVNVVLGHFGACLPFYLCTRCARLLDYWCGNQPWGELLRRLATRAQAARQGYHQSDSEAAVWAVQTEALAHGLELEAWLRESVEVAS